MSQRAGVSRRRRPRAGSAGLDDEHGLARPEVARDRIGEVVGAHRHPCDTAGRDGHREGDRHHGGRAHEASETDARGDHEQQPGDEHIARRPTAGRRPRSTGRATRAAARATAIDHREGRRSPNEPTASPAAASGDAMNIPGRKPRPSRTGGRQQAAATHERARSRAALRRGSRSQRSATRRRGR